MSSIQSIIDLALKEDVGTGDITTEATIPQDLILSGELVSKDNGILSGLDIAEQTFHTLSKEIHFEKMAEDGDHIIFGDILAKLIGPGRAILSAERTALNFLQRMSGIATLTYQYVQAVKGTSCVILDTRKTAPGLRILDKKAVRAAKGVNHRLGLYDQILIKDNHVIACGGIKETICRMHGSRPIEIEVKNLEELKQVLQLTDKVDRVLLDNFNLDEIRRAISLVNKRIPIEVSGGIQLQDVSQIAQMGVDFISVGQLTHSVRALDLSLSITPR